MPFAVDTVDATAAGDVFSGALAAALGNGKPLADALVFASAGRGAEHDEAGRADVDTGTVRGRGVAGGIGVTCRREGQKRAGHKGSARFQRCRVAVGLHPALRMRSPADWRVAWDRACISRLCIFCSEFQLRVLLLTFRQ